MGFTFLCPNGTLFNQKFMICDWYYNVVCKGSDQYYSMNRILGKQDGSDAEIMSEIKKMMTYPMQTVVDRTRNQRKRPPSGGPISPSINADIPTFSGNGPRGVVSGVPDLNGRLLPPLAGDTVFISNLGELSTDPNSLFREEKSNILRVSSDSDDPNMAAGEQILTYPSPVIITRF